MTATLLSYYKLEPQVIETFEVNEPHSLQI